MATMPIDDESVSLREYLNTSYSPDCEFLNGQIVERNLGEKDHSILQMVLARSFGTTAPNGILNCIQD